MFKIYSKIERKKCLFLNSFFETIQRSISLTESPSQPQLLRADRDVKIQYCVAEKVTASSYSLRNYNEMLLILVFITEEILGSAFHHDSENTIRTQ